MVLNKIVTPGCYNQPPLKRISPRDSKQEPEGEHAITFRRSGITRKITWLRILNHTGS